MTAQDFADCAKRLILLWPQAARLEREQMGAYGEVLARFDGTVVLAALESLSREGRDFLPLPGIVLKRVVEMVMDAPTWGDARAQMIERQRAMESGERLPWECPYDECDGSAIVVAEDERVGRPCACRDQMIAARRRDSLAHPMVVEFMTSIGTPMDASDMMRGNRTAEAQTREKWERWVADRVQSIALADVHAPVARIERAHREAPGLAGRAIAELVESISPEAA